MTNEIDFIERMKIATALAGMNMTQFGLLIMYRLLIALESRGGDLTIDEINDITTKAKLDVRQYEDQYPK